jgi:hypothetical protein
MDPDKPLVHLCVQSMRDEQIAYQNCRYLL